MVSLDKRGLFLARSRREHSEAVLKQVIAKGRIAVGDQPHYKGAWPR